MKRTNENVAPGYKSTRDNNITAVNTKPTIKRAKFAEPLETNMSEVGGRGGESVDSSEYDDQESVVSSTSSMMIPNSNNTIIDNEKKPMTGTEEWIKLRRITHNEVERRRRNNINERINELAQLVNSKEKNKGMILRNAITYINTINEKFKQEEEKWTLDKLVAEETIKRLQNQIDICKSRYTKSRALNRELCIRVGKEFEESDDENEEP